MALNDTVVAPDVSVAPVSCYVRIKSAANDVISSCRSLPASHVSVFFLHALRSQGDVRQKASCLTSPFRYKLTSARTGIKETCRMTSLMLPPLNHYTSKQHVIEAKAEQNRQMQFL